MMVSFKNEQEPKYGGYKVQVLFGNSKYIRLTAAHDSDLSEVESED